MNKTAIKNFAVWARKKLIEDIRYKAGLFGISENGTASPLPQSTNDLQFFDIGTNNYVEVAGKEIRQRESLINAIKNKERDTDDFKAAFDYIVEEVAYTWFNRLIAIRFMEVNDYLPSGVRVLSSENSAKDEPDLVTNPFETDLDFSPYEKDRIIQLKDENKLDELFRMLFIKQCNKLHEILPGLFETMDDYTELLLTISFTDNDGIIYHFVHDIDEDDFNVEKEGQVEIIGWMYQYYNIEPKAAVFARKGKEKIQKEQIPAATQLFTPDWIVRYMVENSLGRLWVEGHPNDELKESWKYYLDESEQELEVQEKLAEIREEYKKILPEYITLIDPCMGSGHILVYAFDVLMQIYESYGYTQRDAVQSILKNNLFGLDIDERARQLAYFAVMMKARQYDRRIFSREITPQVYAIKESNGVNRSQLKYFGAGLSDIERKDATTQINSLLDTMTDALEYGSIITVENYDWELLRRFTQNIDTAEQMTIETIGIKETREQLLSLINLGKTLACKYDVVVTNPPYMTLSNGNAKLNDYVKKFYPNSKNDLFAVFMERCQQMCKAKGYQAMITMHSWMFLSTFEKLRESILSKDIINMVHLGARAFEEIGGEVVQTTSFVMIKNHIDDYKGTYCRLIEPTTQKGKEDMYLAGENRFIADQINFSKIPGNPVAYWASSNLLKDFVVGDVLKSYGDTRQGMATSDNSRFLRIWYEVDINKLGIGCNSVDAANSCKKKWYPYNKGGEYRKWYGNIEFTVNYENDGFEIKKYAASLYKSPSRTIKSMSEYFKRCLSWSKISSGNIAFRYYPDGFIFDVAGCCIFYNDNMIMLYDFGFLNSIVSKQILAVISPTLNYEAGHIANIPVIRQDKYKNKIVILVKENIHIGKEDWNTLETSWDFKKHPLV